MEYIHLFKVASFTLNISVSQNHPQVSSGCYNVNKLLEKHTSLVSDVSLCLFIFNYSFFL